MSGPEQSTTRPIRVLLWSPKGAGLQYGGPGMSAYRLYSADEKGRFEVTLAHGRVDQEHYDLFRQQYYIGAVGLNRSLDNVRFLRAARRWLGDHAKSFDVFHGLQAFHLTVKPAWWAERTGLPAVVKIAAHRSDLADKGGLRGLLRLPARRRRMVREISAAIAISREIEQELLGYGIPREKVVFIPNGVDTSRFRPACDPSQRAAARQQLGWPDKPTTLFVGGIVARKRPLELVDALAQVRARGHDVQLILAGPDHSEPQYAQRIRARIDELKARDAVIWQPFVADVAPLYRAADIFALPSKNEGMPNALLEAMASGLPSVVTAISGITDLVEDGRQGMIVEPEPELIADALAAYFDDESLRSRHGQAARERVEQSFSATAVLDAHEDLFRRIMRP